MTSEKLKKDAAKAAIKYVTEECVIGVGTGTTINYFIDELAAIRHKIEGAVPSSKETEKRLKALNIPIFDLNHTSQLPIYIDGADEFNDYLYLIKGGGGALTREKIIAANAKTFICIVDESKKVDILGKFPLPIEVLPIARSYVAREMVKLGGDPEYRAGFVTNNGNVILDVYNLTILDPVVLEKQINHIAGVVSNGIFAIRPADIVLMATASGVTTLLSKDQLTYR